jgi:hypothetical protein
MLPLPLVHQTKPPDVISDIRQTPERMAWACQGVEEPGKK